MPNPVKTKLSSIRQKSVETMRKASHLFRRDSEEEKEAKAQLRKERKERREKEYVEIPQNWELMTVYPSMYF
ncbi:hypothetical protein L596_029154 [Steinernema carpocapsae]|uniref:Uncharacterized protein n=1 Tax=Steinernema carpocapsae TaxID=34508 RepID=A0A4U5LTT4_STECR|nr:hypothetical protein L596_029154 [Steinernema carpocapsae]